MLSRPLAFVVLAHFAAAGCNGATAGPGDGGASADLAPITCNGTINGGFYGAFNDCTASISDSAQFELLRLVPTKYKGDMLYMALIGSFIPGQIAARTYKLSDLGPDTQVTFTLQYQMQRWFAGKDTQGAPTGEVTLQIDTLPQRPQGATDWEDKAIHGHLTATLKHDPMSPGMDVPVQFEATF